jgi:hypothetical protein
MAGLVPAIHASDAQNGAEQATRTKILDSIALAALVGDIGIVV